MRLKDIFRTQKYVCILAWALIGFVFAYIACSVILSGSTSITSLYDVGDVYEVRDSVYKTAITLEKGHQENSGKVVLDDGLFEYQIEIEKNENQYKYFCIQLKNLSIKDVEWTIDFRKQKNNEILKNEKNSYLLHEGMNLIYLPKNSFNTIAIEITGENDTSFYVEKMQMRETKPCFDGEKALEIVFVTYLLYILLSGALLFIWRKIGISFRFYSWIESLQEIYIIIAGQFKKIQERMFFLQKYKNYLVTSFFVLMFSYSVLVEILRVYYIKFKYHAFIYLVLLLIITMLSVESKPEKKNWNNSLVWSWLILWIIACISDFLLPKYFRFIGYVMVFAVGFFIFIWNNMEKPEGMIKNFVRAVHIFLVLITIFCLLFRPDVSSDARYSGIIANPSIFALYLATIFAVLLGELENAIRNEVSLKYLLFYIAEGCVTLVFMVKSQSLCPLLTIAGIAFIWFVRMAYYTKKEHCRKKLVLVVISGLILLTPTYTSIDWGVKHIPQSLGTSITYEGEELIAKRQFGMTVYAGDLKEKIRDSRLGHKLNNASLSGILSGRNYYYKAYLREMNLFGHKENPEMWGKKRLPHNAVLGIAHRYGVFGSAPYIIMLIMVIIRTFRYSKKKVPYAAVPFYVCVSSIVMSMADNVEQPFVWLPWIGLYLMMGCVFDNNSLKE